jgi:hypothetical protein
MVHVRLAAQATHTTPAVPHALADGDTHTPVAQQPVGHVAEVQAIIAHTWPIQRSDGAQA